MFLSIAGMDEGLLRAARHMYGRLCSERVKEVVKEEREIKKLQQEEGLVEKINRIIDRVIERQKL